MVLGGWLFLMRGTPVRNLRASHPSRAYFEAPEPRAHEYLIHEKQGVSEVRFLDQKKIEAGVPPAFRSH